MTCKRDKLWNLNVENLKENQILISREKFFTARLQSLGKLEKADHHEASRSSHCNPTQLCSVEKTRLSQVVFNSTDQTWLHNENTSGNGVEPRREDGVRTRDSLEEILITNANDNIGGEGSRASGFICVLASSTPSYLRDRLHSNLEFTRMRPQSLLSYPLHRTTKFQAAFSYSAMKYLVLCLLIFVLFICCFL